MMKLILALFVLLSLNVQGAEVSPPQGFVAYCSTKPQPDECYLHTKPSSLNARPDLSVKDLAEVNHLVNARMHSVSDPEKYGKLEVWVDPTDWAGDCEDYVLKKIHLLQAKGWPSENLRIATARYYDGVPQAVIDSLVKNHAANHAVLIAIVDNIQYVLDSKKPAGDTILPVREYVEQYGVKITTIQSLEGKWIEYEQQR